MIAPTLGTNHISPEMKSNEPLALRPNSIDSTNAHPDICIRQIPTAAAKCVEAAGREGDAVIIVPVDGHAVSVADGEIGDSLLRWLQ